MGAPFSLAILRISISCNSLILRAASYFISSGARFSGGQARSGKCNQFARNGMVRCPGMMTTKTARSTARRMAVPQLIPSQFPTRLSSPRSLRGLARTRHGRASLKTSRVNCFALTVSVGSDWTSGTFPALVVYSPTTNPFSVWAPSDENLDTTEICARTESGMPKHFPSRPALRESHSVSGKTSAWSRFSRWRRQSSGSESHTGGADLISKQDPTKTSMAGPAT
jgi:hypothetical protein